MEPTTENLKTEPKPKNRLVPYLINAAIFILGGVGGIILTQYFDKHPFVQPAQPHIKYSIHENDSIFRDSMFGDIRIKQYLIYVTNEGDANASNAKVKITTLLDMEIGTDIGVKKDEKDYGGPDSTFTRLYFIKDPIKPGQRYRFNVIMDGNYFERVYKSYLSKPGNDKKSLPAISVECDQGFGSEKKNI